MRREYSSAFRMSKLCHGGQFGHVSKVLTLSHLLFSSHFSFNTETVAISLLSGTKAMAKLSRWLSNTLVLRKRILGQQVKPYS